MGAFDNFLKNNVSGTLNKVFLAGYVADIAGADNKWKAVLKTVKEIVVWNSRLILPATFIAGFIGMGRALRAIVRDTGSLEGALRRLSAIQGLQRTFTPLLGGINAAKQRVAELVALTSRTRLFRFEEVGEAAVKLETLTRGIYSTDVALETIQDSAVASNNGIVQVADAVGRFYDDLRSGEPIDAASEQLRQMGVISGDTAKFLDRLQASGASTQQVFTELTATMAAMKPAKPGEDLASVQKRQAAAGENLQHQIGAPFTADEIENIKNYTDASNALAPVLGRISAFLATLTNGFSTFKSGVAKTAAESKNFQDVLEGGGKGMGALVAGAAAIGAAFLAMRLVVFAATGTISVFGLALQTTSIGVLGTIARLGALATGIGLVAAAGIYVAGAMKKYEEEQERIIQQSSDMAAAAREAQAAMEAQAAAITTLAERSEFLAKAKAKILDLDKQLAELAKQPENLERDSKEANLILARTKAQKELNRVAKEGVAGLTGPGKEAAIQAEIERARIQRRASYENALVRHAPEGEDIIRAKRLADMREDERAAGAGVQARSQTETARAQAGGKVAVADAGVQAANSQLARALAARADLEDERLHGLRGTDEQRIAFAEKIDAADGAIAAAKEKQAAAQKALGQLTEKQMALGLRAVKDSSVFAEEMARRMILMQRAREVGGAERARLEGEALGGANGAQRAAIRRSTPQDIENFQAFAASRRSAEANLPGLTEAREREQASAEEDARQRRVRGVQEDLDLRSRSLRRTGNSSGAQAAEDTASFLSNFEENRAAGMSSAEAKRRALAKTNEDIAGSRSPGSQVIADSLQRIGGGGGAYGQAGDAMLETAKRQATLLENIKAVLDAIEQGGRMKGGVL